MNAPGPVWSYAHLERLSGISQNSWGAYANEARPLTVHAMSWIERLYEFPKESFRTYPRAGGSSAPPSIVGSIAQLPESERSELANLLHQILKAPKKRRAKIIERVRRVVRSYGKSTAEKMSSS